MYLIIHNILSLTTKSDFNSIDEEDLEYYKNRDIFFWHGYCNLIINLPNSDFNNNSLLRMVRN